MRRNFWVFIFVGIWLLILIVICFRNVVLLYNFEVGIFKLFKFVKISLLIKLLGVVLELMGGLSGIEFEKMVM